LRVHGYNLDETAKDESVMRRNDLEQENQALWNQNVCRENRGKKSEKRKKFDKVDREEPHYEPKESEERKYKSQKIISRKKTNEGGGTRIERFMLPTSWGGK